MRRFVLFGVAALALSACSSDETAPVDTRPTTGRETTTGDVTTTDETDTEAARGAPQVRLVRVIAGLSALTHVTVAPGEAGRLYVVEQEGRIRILKGRQVLSRPFLDIADLVQSGGEQGLLSVAFHPNYERNRLFYVNYTDVNGDTRVVEYRTRPEGEPARTRELLFVEQPYSNHNGGQLMFGPDGRLYVGMGDGGSGGDPENRAQDLGERLGKLLSIDVDGDADWRIDGYGLRNPWRFSFDRATGDLYIGDVGQGAWEEINFLPRRSPGLENFGWDVLEGDHQFEDKEPNPQGRLLGPITEYSLSGDNCSVIGGFVYRGDAIPSARGHYFYGDFCSGLVWSLAVRDGKATDDKRHPFQVQGLSSFGEDARGELYLVSLNGEIFRLAPA